MTNQFPDDDDTRFVKAVSELLRRSAEEIDGATASRLNRARQSALEQLPRPWRTSPWLAPALSTAAIGALLLVLWLGPGVDRDVPPPVLYPSDYQTAADLDLLLTDDSFEMLEDLEFYAWLEADRSDDELGAELEAAS